MHSISGQCVLLQGRWYITAGLNPLFDDFDCQEHYFGVPEPGKLYGKINWRIKKPDNDFIDRSTVQTFKQVCLWLWKTCCTAAKQSPFPALAATHRLDLGSPNAYRANNMHALVHH